MRVNSLLSSAGTSSFFAGSGGFGRRTHNACSERDFILIAGLVTFVPGLLCPAQEIDGLGDDLATVAVDAFSVGPLSVVDSAAHQDLHALLAVLLDRLAEAVEAGDAVPFGVLNAVAVLVAEHLALGVTRARGGEGEVGNGRAALGGAGFRGLTDVAGEDDDVLHVQSPLLQPEGPSLR